MRTELGQGSGIEVDDKGREVVGSSEDGKDEGEDGLMNGVTDRTSVGFTLGSETDVGTSLRMIIGDALGNEDESIGIPLESTLSSEEGMDNGMQDGTVVGASLGLRVGDDELGNEGGLFVVATVDLQLGFTLSSDVRLKDGMQDGTDDGTSLELKDGETLGNNDGMVDGATDSASVGVTVGSEEGG